MRFLLFTLVAPLASFGAVAVGERRAGWDRPAKSAVLGLVAGALGVTRAEEEAHHALANDYFLALRVEDLATRAPRRLMSDFHTAQSPPAARGRRYATRREELDADNLATVLTRREYRTDCSFTAALWSEKTPRFSLEEIAAALKAPVFTPYLGRKSCPLALPMAPRLFDSETLFAAFERYDDELGADIRKFREDSRLAARPLYAAIDGETKGGLRSNRARMEKRRDHVVHRGRRQFALREEIVMPLDGGAHG